MKKSNNTFLTDILRFGITGCNKKQVKGTQKTSRKNSENSQKFPAKNRRNLS